MRTRRDALKAKFNNVQSDKVLLSNDLYMNKYPLYDTDNEIEIQENPVAHCIGYAVSVVDRQSKRAIVRLASSDNISADKLIQRIKSDYKSNKIKHRSYFNNVVMEY